MTTPKTAFGVWLAVAAIGGRFRVADGLRMLLPPDCPVELKAAIRTHRPALLALFALNFLVVDSAALKTIVIWASDEVTKNKLVAHGADPDSIYTAAELKTLVRRRITTGELPLIHEARKRFSGRVTEL